jgi:hypothetical protein
MAEPEIVFAFNHAGSDISWSYQGLQGEETNKDGYRAISPFTDLLVWTGGGIIGSLPTPTTTSGSRDATIRPSTSPYVIPQLFVEQDIMYHCALVGKNTNRYTMAVRITGTATSDLYLESFDDNTMSSTDLEILQGTTNNGNNSFINAIRTTAVEPPSDWNGSSAGAAYLRGTEHRVALNNSATITDSTVYYNIYIELPTDVSTWHVQPIIAFRYLYT